MMKEKINKLLAQIDLEIDEIDLYGYDIIETSLSMVHRLQNILIDLKNQLQTYVFVSKAKTWNIARLVAVRRNIVTNQSSTGRLLPCITVPERSVVSCPQRMQKGHAPHGSGAGFPRRIPRPDRLRKNSKESTLSNPSILCQNINKITNFTFG